MEFCFFTILGIIKLFILVIAGTVIGSILDYKGWAGYISFIIRPFLKFAKLPPICGTSFITAVFSNSAASAILAGAEKDNYITRKEMIVTGIIDTFPTHIAHLTKALFILIPLIGPAGIVYYLITVICDLVRTFAVIIYNRINSDRINFSEFSGFKKQEITWKEISIRIRKRILEILKKLIIVFIPLYIIASYLVYIGFFKTISAELPLFLNKILSPGILSISLSKAGGLTASATTANTLLVNSQITGMQVLAALFIGNMITIPINTARRNLPAAIAIFPRKDGLWIVLITELIRFTLNLIVIIILFVLIN